MTRQYTPGSVYTVCEIANARLIAAAPELLEALKGLLARADRYSDLTETKDWPEQAAARAAIAKAEPKLLITK